MSHYHPPGVETLEDRQCPSFLAPVQQTGAPGYTPDQLLDIYGLCRPMTAGAGQAIAVVVAHDDPTICSDLHAFDQANGIPDPLFAIVNQEGGPSLPNSSDPGWSVETALDVEWAHALAPGAAILLVEAGTADVDALVLGAYTAAHWPGVGVVSVSWGSNAVPADSVLGSLIQAPGVVVVAAAGDTAQPIWPADAPGVLPVGGTTLRPDGTETGWLATGPGLVAWDADPATGVEVVSGGTVLDVGGTSAGAPAWAGIVARADGLRAAQGEPPLSGADDVLARLGARDLRPLRSPTGSAPYDLAAF